MTGLLAKLVALANRPGTPAEGERARAHAERLARRDGADLVLGFGGELLILGEFHADLHRRLQEIADPTDPRRRDRLEEGGSE